MLLCRLCILLTLHLLRPALLRTAQLRFSARQSLPLQFCDPARHFRGLCARQQSHRQILSTQLSVHADWVHFDGGDGAL